jgi:hypothetical protein
MVLNQAYCELDQEVPGWMSRALAWIRKPSRIWLRLPLSLALIVAAFFAFLPVLGVEMLPIGLLLLAEDVPFLRKPVGKAILWLIAKWRAAKAWWHRGSGRTPKRP